MKDERRNLSEEQIKDLLGILKERFNKNMNRHQGLEWDKVTNVSIVPS
jgi:hypothetical protein